MTNTKLFLLIGTSLYLIPNLASAQCVATQDCATLGYTETSCSGGSGVKCPFGNKWACFKTDAEFCNEYGFALSCTGSNQVGGAGKACNGKYNYCTCAEGYVWQNGACKQSSPDYSGCVVGALYYSDGTCSDKLESAKTLLGVVIYEKSASQNGWIIAVKPIQADGSWLTIDIPELATCQTLSCLTDIQDSCTNTDIITAYGDSSTFPIAWAAKNYKPTGTPSEKNWCLPSGGLLNVLANSKYSTNLAKVNAGITTAGGTILGNSLNMHETIWSSSKYTVGMTWYLAIDAKGYSPSF